MSRPIVETVCMGELLRIVGATSSANIFGTLVPVVEPSTASKADSCTATWVGRINVRLTDVELLLYCAGNSVGWASFITGRGFHFPVRASLPGA
jgi:hypothetical protein